MTVKTVFSWLVAVMTVTVSFAQETDPGAIFKKVTAAYAAMETFSGEGVITEDVDTGGTKMTLKTLFSIKLKKPNMYLISWDQKNAMMPFDQAGAVWSDGTQPYLYMGVAKAYSKMNSDTMALSGVTGISGGAAFTIPSLFLTSFQKQQGNGFSRFLGAQITGAEQIAGKDCFVISGSSTISVNETYWISKDDYMIRKYFRSLDVPAGASIVPKLTEPQMEQAIKAMGQEVTPETKEAMKKMMQQQADHVTTAKLKGTSTEVYTTIETPKLSAGDFAFKVPADAVLKASLFGGMFK